MQRIYPLYGVPAGSIAYKKKLCIGIETHRNSDTGRKKGEVYIDISTWLKRSKEMACRIKHEAITSQDSD
jgi:hypothetical protein